MAKIKFAVVASVTLLVLSTFALPVQAGNRYLCDNFTVIDGDTVKCYIEIWPDIFTVARIRVAGIDTPEKRPGLAKKCRNNEKALAKEAEDYTRGLLKAADVVYVLGPAHGKFARRTLGEIELHKDGAVTVLSKLLLVAGYARKYDGKGKRGLWCPETLKK